MIWSSFQSNSNFCAKKICSSKFNSCICSRRSWLNNSMTTTKSTDRKLFDKIDWFDIEKEKTILIFRACWSARSLTILKTESVLRACLGGSFGRVLSYQREAIWGLVRSRALAPTIYFWHSVSHVHICFLDQISSLCYLFPRHAPYIIFDLHRDGRCKLHTRYQAASE